VIDGTVAARRLLLLLSTDSVKKRPAAGNSSNFDRMMSPKQKTVDLINFVNTVFSPSNLQSYHTSDAS